MKRPPERALRRVEARRVALSCLLSLGLATLAPSAVASIWPTSHARVADALESGDVSERRTAAAKLLQLPPKLARALAKTALSDEDVEVRLSAARAAASLGVEGAGDEVVAWLQDPDANLRVAACELIEAAPTELSVQALARVLSDAKAEVRRAAAAAMGASGMSDAVSPLLGHLDDGSAPVRLEVVRALGRIGDPRAVVPMVSRLQDQSSDVRRETARALGQLGDKRAAATLMLALQDKSVAVRVQALDALGRLRAEESVAAIAALLSATGESLAGADLARGPMQDAALRALGRIGTPEAVEILIGALAQEGPLPLGSGVGGPGVRAPVREAIALAGAAAVPPLLAKLTASPSQGLASAIALTLARVGATASVAPIIDATRRGTVALDQGLLALGALGDKSALPFVLEKIDAGDSRIRQVVVGVASELLEPSDADGRAVDIVEARVLDLRTPVGERIALVKLLGRTGSPRALPILLELKKSKPSSLRVAVIRALGSLGSAEKAVDDVLLDALEETSEGVRTAAAEALADVGRDAAAAKLIHRLGVSAEQDRAAIGIGLSGALGRSTDPKLVAKVKRALASASGASRDALIEGLGRMKIDAARELLGELALSTHVDDRRKVAEALAGHSKAEPVLLKLLGDPDAGVRANAAWSLGQVGVGPSLSKLAALVSDLDVAVAGNAGVALARAATRAKRPETARKALCGALTDYRSYVRASALTGLRELGVSCPSQEPVRHVVRRDPSWRARLAAARLLSSVKVTGKDAELNRRALTRCAAEDRDAAVAKACGASPSASPPRERHEVLVYVVPDGKTTPTPGAPFALVLADGSLRLGIADRRGALFERAAPAGVLELAVPAALAR